MHVQELSSDARHTNFTATAQVLAPGIRVPVTEIIFISVIVSRPPIQVMHHANSYISLLPHVSAAYGQAEASAWACECPLYMITSDHPYLRTQYK